MERFHVGNRVARRGRLRSPSAVVSGVGQLDVFVRGIDKALWRNDYRNGSWAGWGSLGGIMYANPSAVSWGPNRLDIFVRGSDSALYHAWSSDASTFYGFENVGATFLGTPSVVSWGANRLDMFVRGTDSAEWHDWWSNGWGSWQGLGGSLK